MLFMLFVYALCAILQLLMQPKNILRFEKQQVVPPKAQAQQFNYARLKSSLQLSIVRNTPQHLQLQLQGIDAATANALRRIIIAQIPTMAFHKVLMYQNTSVIPDELLVHRLGLLPIQVDPDLFQSRGDNQEVNPQNSLKFQLKVVCRRKKEYQHSSEEELQDLKPEQYLDNCNIYSNQIVWVPQGNQSAKNITPNLVHPNILVTKLRQNQQLFLQLFAEKGIGKKHAKWSPVSTCFYRLMPSIKIEDDFNHEKYADVLVDCCPAQVFAKKKSKAVVVRERDCTTCRECIKIEHISLGKVSDHFICTSLKYVVSVESTGIFPAEQIFLRALKVLQDKAKAFVI